MASLPTDRQQRIERLGEQVHAELATVLQRYAGQPDGLFAVLRALRSSWFEAVLDLDEATQDRPDDRALGRRLLTRWAQAVFQVSTSANPDVTLEALGYAFTAISVIVMAPTGSVKTLTIQGHPVRLDDIQRAIGVPRATRHVLSPTEQLFYDRDSRETINVEATKLTAGRGRQVVRGTAAYLREDTAPQEAP